MRTHLLKAVSPYFEAIANGSKPFDVRRNDKSFQRGDQIRFVEWVEAKDDRPGYPTDREFLTTITYVYSGDPRFEGHGGLQTGYVVLGLDLPDPIAPPSFGEAWPGSATGTVVGGSASSTVQFPVAVAGPDRSLV